MGGLEAGGTDVLKMLLVSLARDQQVVELHHTRKPSAALWPLSFGTIWVQMRLKVEGECTGITHDGY